MCLGIPGEVMAFVDAARQVAVVEFGGTRREVDVTLLLDEGLEVGEWVLVHVGVALSKIDETEAEETRSFFEQLGQMDEAGLDALFPRYAADDDQEVK